MSIKVIASAAVLALAATPASAAQYMFTSLGDLPGGLTYSSASGINEAGQVSGTAQAADGPRAYLWSAGVMQDLGRGNGVGVNASGQVAGIGAAAGTIYSHAKLYSVGSVQDLGDLPGGQDQSYAYDVNNAGQVVGASSAANGAERAFLWSGGVMQDLGDLPGGGNQSRALAINEAGQVAGYSSASSGHHAFLWSGGVMQDLGSLGGSSYGQAVNNAGQVAGMTGLAGGGQHAFLWSGGVMHDLGDLAGGIDYSYAYGINDAGDVVGVGDAASPTARAVLWSGGQIIDLNTVVDAAGWTLTDASAINNKGQIVGTARHTDGSRVAYLLTPVSSGAPEPAAWAVMILGLGAAGAALRRRRSPVGAH